MSNLGNIKINGSTTANDPLYYCLRRQHSFRSPLVVAMTSMFVFSIMVSSCIGFSTTASLSRQLLSLYSNSRLYLKSDGLTVEERDAKIVKATKAMTAFTNKYLKNTETTLCSEKSIPAVVIKGLAEHKVDLGAPLCPCRFYEDKEKEVKDGYWNCPCVPMREEKVCHCMLFLTEDNAFAGDSQTISIEEVVKLSGGVK